MPLAGSMADLGIKVERLKLMSKGKSRLREK